MTRPNVLNYTAGPMPPGAIYIGRAMPGKGLVASPWANPHRIAHDDDRPAALADYLGTLRGSPALLTALPTLAGQDIVCWCHPKACHGHVLGDCVAALPEGDPVEALKRHCLDRATEHQALALLEGWISDLVRSWADVARCDAVRWWIRDVVVARPAARELF